MSEIKKKLLEPVITKKQIIWVIVLAGVLVTTFAFSSYFFSLVLGTQRDEPSEELDKAEHKNEEKLQPHFPVDIDALWDWLEDNLDELDLADLQDLRDLGIDISDIDPAILGLLNETIDEQTIVDFVEEMMDGTIDDYNLAIAGLAIAALLFSNVEVFRVYDYDNSIDAREDILWKYECFDEFRGNGWSSTVPMEQTSFIDRENYDNNFFNEDQIRIKRPLSVVIGGNSFTIGSLFPTPYIIEDRIYAPNLEQTILFKNDFDCVTGTLYFSDVGDYNMSYELFGLDLPSNDDINNSAVSAIYNPSDPDFQKFLQIPGGLSSYLSSNPYFASHQNILDTTINANDNAFVVANKIRNYLQNNFDYSFEALINDQPGDNEDIVEWFSEHEEGLSSEFASAFSIFCRSFGVGSRFLDGFNSRLIEEFYDDDENQMTYPIRYKNIYNWVEVYIPYDTLGNGQWVQMDVLYDSYGVGGAPVGPERFNISVLANNSDYNIFNRNDYVQLTAKINSTGYIVDGRTVTFTDLTTDQVLGTNITNANGFTSILVHLDNTHRVGPHAIEGSVLRSEDDTYYILDDEIRVILENVSPAEVNVSETPHTTLIEGYVEDPLNSQRIDYANVSFLLLYKGTNDPVNVPDPLNPKYTVTDFEGSFDTTLDVADYNPYGEYDVRVDFNGSWVYPDPLPLISFPLINDSSDVLDFNITKEIIYDIRFFINGTPTEYPYDPTLGNLIVAKRYNNINLTAIVIDAETKNKVLGVPVEFYDYTNGNNFIGSVVSGANGNASIVFSIGATFKAGPTLVYAKIGSIRNYSYYIVDESIYFSFLSGPNPREINIYQINSDSFNINGYVTDNKGNQVGYTEIELKLFNKDYIDYSDYLVPSESYPYITGNDGSFNLNFEVDPNNVPAGNYTLRLDFNGSFYLSNDPNNNYDFDFVGVYSLGYLSNSTIFEKELKIFDPGDIKIFLAVDGYPTPNPNDYDDTYKPRSYIRGIGQVGFQIRINQSGSAVESGYVTIWDEYSSRLLYNYTYDGTEIPKGYVQIDIPTENFWSAGIHKIRVRYMDFATTNITYIIINETVSVNTISIIQTGGIDNVVLRSNGGFTVNGFIWENQTGLRGLRVRLLLFNETNDDVSYYLIGNFFALTNATGNYTIQINAIDLAAPRGRYYIRVDFNGSINLIDTPGINLIQNYMINESSNIVYLNVTAGTSIIYGYYDTRVVKDTWYEGDDLYVYGNLTWDNTLAIENMKVNVTVRDSSNQILTFIIDPSVTDINGFFNVTLVVGQWPSDAQVWIYFFPENNFPSPDFYYVEQYQIQVFRQP